MKSVQHLIVAVGLTLAGCTASPKPAPRPATISPTTLAATPHDLSAGQAMLAARLYPRLAEQAGPDVNLFVSPLSLSEGLGLAVLGARGKSETEIRALLGWDGLTRPEQFVADYDRFLRKTDDPDVALAVANALWLDNDLAFRSGYLDAAAAVFGAKPQPLDFGSAPQASADRINAWIAQETRERIKQIVAANAFNDSTAAVLTNAVWFKARWSVPFYAADSGVFTRGDGSKVPIAFIERVAPLAYRTTDEGQAVALPYGRDGRFVMEIFLPKDARVLEAWEQGLKPLSFSAGEQGSDGRFDLEATTEQMILLRIPRFEARFNASIKPALVAAGVGCAFDDACADFSAMAAAPLAISDVAHATFLRLDEEGTEAAAATAVTIVTTSAPNLKVIPKMIVDRPFLVTIRDRASGALIFFGRIADPTPVEKKP